MSYIFSVAFGVVDLHDIDNDPRFVEVSRKKGFKKKSALPTPKALKEEIVRRAKNSASGRVPKPNSWNVKKCKDWLCANGDMLSLDDIEFLKSKVGNFYDFHLQSVGDNIGEVADISSGVPFRPPKISLIMMRLWHIFCDPSLRKYFLQKDCARSRADRDTGASTLLAEDGGSFYDKVAELFNNILHQVYSSCFAGVYYKLESSILLPPPNSDEILDADQVKRQYVKARAILAKVCFVSFFIK